MTSQDEIYRKYMDILSGMFKKSYEDKGIKASGAWGDSLNVFSSPKKVGVEAEFESTMAITKGRKAGSYSDVDAIKQWIKVKQGLPQAFKDNPDKFAFLISRKHFRDGIKIPNKHNKGNVLSEPIDKFVRNHLPNMWRELGGSYIFELQSTITKNFKK